jgi:membrane protein EpsK
MLFTTAAFTVTTFASTLAVFSYAYHRFDLRLLVNVIRLVTQMGSLLVLFTVLSPRLWQVGFGIFLSALVSLLGHGVLWRRLAPELKIRLNLFDPSHLKQMLGFSGWVLVNQVGSLLFLNIDLIVANLVFGAEVAGRYGAVLVLPTVLRTLVATVDDVLKPVIFTLYAQNNPSRLLRVSCLSVKFIGLVTALPVGLICGLAKPVLTIWLGPEFADLSWLVVVLVGHLCINVAVVPLFSLQVATGNVRIPGIVTLLMGVANTVLAVALALWSGWGYISIAIAGAIVLTAKNVLFTPLYSARILKLSWWTFLPSIIIGIIGSLVVGVGAYWVSATWTLTSLWQLVLIGAIISGVYMVAMYFGGLNADDRYLLKSEIQRRLKR